MASRFRKVGITAVGACAGAALSAWALNNNDAYTVPIFTCSNFNLQITSYNEKTKYNFNKFRYKQHQLQRQELNDRFHLELTK